MKYRVVNRVTRAEVIHDLFHLGSSWRINAMQPGLSGASAIGDFTITLPPPFTEEYRAHFADYSLLDYFLRIEGYVEAIAGQPKVAGFITGITEDSGQYVLTGATDPWLAQRQRAFPGENLVEYTYGMWRYWLGGTEVGFSDDFSGASPLTNYTSTHVPGLTSGTWTATTDDGLPSVTCSTGTGATLLSTTATNLSANDDRSASLLELTGRILVNGTDATNNGEIGLVFGADANNCTLVKVRLRRNGTIPNNNTADITCQRWAAGVSVAGPTTVTAALTTVGPTAIPGYADVQIQVNISTSTVGGGIWVTVNGQLIPGGSTTQYQAFDNMQPADLTNVQIGPYFGVPATSTAQAYVASLYTMVRFTNGNSNRAALFTGTFNDTLSNIGVVGTAGPAFLDQFQRATEMEGRYWRYTPQALVPGIRTIGSFAWGTSPGTDVSGSVRFLGGDNLVDVLRTPPAAGVSTSVQLNGPASDSGGQIIARNKSALATYGVIDDNQLNLTAQEYRSLRKNAQSLVGSQGSPASAVTLVVLRDPQTADRWRELDIIYAHWPERGISNQIYKVFSYTLEEGSPRQQIQVGQYGAQQVADRVRRTFYSLQQVGNTFRSR